MKRGPRTPKKPAPANQRRAPPSLRPSLAGPATPGPLDSRTDPRACPSAPAGPLPAPSRRPLLPMPPPRHPYPAGRLLRPLLQTLSEGGKPSVPSARGAPAKAQLRRRAPVTLSQASSGSAKGSRARAGGLLLPLRSAVWSISLPEALEQVKGAGGARPAPAGNPLFSDSRGPICPGCPLCLPLRSTPWRAGPGLLGTPLRGRGGRRLPGKARRDRELEREAAGAGPLQPDRAGERPPYLPLRAPRNACCLARTRCLSVSLSLLPAFSFKIHQRVKSDRREASSLFCRLGAQQELLKDNAAPGTIPGVRQACPAGARTPGPSAGGSRPAGRPRSGERRSRAEASRGAAAGASARTAVDIRSPRENRVCGCERETGLPRSLAATRDPNPPQGTRLARGPRPGAREPGAPPPEGPLGDLSVPRSSPAAGVLTTGAHGSRRASGPDQVPHRCCTPTTQLCSPFPWVPGSMHLPQLAAWGAWG
ncbi:uncharacterized protein [Vicugna pacos]|uniref:Basic proline-rich protein-like n=1 Tax=Vicugna pacos TaxID=30538 RepID=A0ABM5BKD6_VICPA